MPVITITNENFESEVLKSDKPVLLDFWATWCGPCRAFGPVVDAYAEQHPEVKVGKINVDEQAELARTYKVMSIPTAMVVKDGQVANRVSGAMDASQLEEFMNV